MEYNVKYLKGFLEISERTSMRRKLFFVTIITIMLVFAMDTMGITLIQSNMVDFVGQEGQFIGKVKNIQNCSSGYIDGYKIEANFFDEANNKWTSDKILIKYYGEIEEPWQLYGSIIKFDGKIEKPSGRRNPGAFDYAQYLRSKNITAVSSSKSITIVSEPQSKIEKFQQWIFYNKMTFVDSLDTSSKGIIAGVLFGDVSHLDEDIYEQFKENGTAHILAVSGLHMGILYSVFQKIAGKRLQKKQAIIIILILAFYGNLAMWSTSAMRAIGMIYMSLIAQFTDRRYDFLTAMSFVALVFILKNPYVIFNMGFQMSFLSAASISFFMPRMPQKLPPSLAIMPAVNLGVMPYQWYHFNILSPISFVANIPVVHMTGVVLPASMIRFAMHCFGMPIKILDAITDFLSSFLVKINEISAFGGIGVMELTSPPLWSILIFYFVIFFLASETFEIMRIRGQLKKIIAILTSLVLLAILISVSVAEPVAKCQLVFIDVGQGDCTQIKDGKKTVVIDGGGNIHYNLGKKTLKPYFLKTGVKHIDLALATHMHTDHYKGLEELQEEGMIENIRVGIAAGRTFTISKDCKIEAIWPLKVDENTDLNKNENCSVFIIYYKGKKIIVTGDIDEIGERQLVNIHKGTDKLKADILQIGHHGSQYSTCQEFLDAVSPNYCVIQVGKNNYGHPSAKVIEKCFKKGIMLFRNDENGAVGFHFKNGEMRAYTMI
jgi:DNA internalization-related competence protein ComEC/Rec2